LSFRRSVSDRRAFPLLAVVELRLDLIDPMSPESSDHPPDRLLDVGRSTRLDVDLQDRPDGRNDPLESIRERVGVPDSSEDPRSVSPSVKTRMRIEERPEFLELRR